MSRVLAPTPLKSLQDMVAFGHRLSTVLRRGDIVTLSGDLGAGKTTLARAIIQGFGVEDEVPSPTYTLVQTYGAKNVEIWHFDLYRLQNPSDIWALGIDEALEDGISLIEWPQRIAPLLSGHELAINIEFTHKGRIVSAAGNPDWQERFVNV